MGTSDVAKEKVPGVTFNLQYHQLKNTSDKDTKLAKVVIQAHIKDLELWERVKTKLDGLRIYSSGTYKDEIIDTLGEELDHTDEAKERNEAALENAFAAYLKLYQRYEATALQLGILQDMLRGLEIDLGIPMDAEYDVSGGTDDDSSSRRPDSCG